jgi:hypothetical protein
MQIKITDPATSESGILTAEYEECTGYLVIGSFINYNEALDLATDHFTRLSPDNDDTPPWGYIMHCRNQAGEYVRAGEIW